MNSPDGGIKLKVLITVKTYPIPSKKYDELVCTAGVTEQGDFIRLYPINFRELPYMKQYQKYQWIEVLAKKHQGYDVRKESYRPVNDSLQILGEPIPSNPGNWSERMKFVLAKKSQSLEELQEKQQADHTSLGIFKPYKIHDLVISPDTNEWSQSFLNELKQQRLFECRQNTLVPPRKVPYKFQYCFKCDDPRCKGTHKIMIEDWEVGAFFWRMVDKGCSPEEASLKVRDNFLDKLCGPDKDTHFYVGTLQQYPKIWVVLGLLYPKKKSKKGTPIQESIFFDEEVE